MIANDWVAQGYMDVPQWDELPNTVVLGIAGRARSGKDTIANHIANTHPGVRVQGFAWALKAYCHVAHGMTTKDSPLLQVVGTNVFRHRDPDVWIKVLYNMTRNDPPKMLIIPDVRFSNEADFIKDVGGYLVKVARKGYVDPSRDPNHPSETGVDEITNHDEYFLIQSGDITGLKDVAGLLFHRAVNHHVKMFPDREGL